MPWHREAEDSQGPFSFFSEFLPGSRPFQIRHNISQYPLKASVVTLLHVGQEDTSRSDCALRKGYI